MTRMEATKDADHRGHSSIFARCENTLWSLQTVTSCKIIFEIWGETKRHRFPNLKAGHGRHSQGSEVLSKIGNLAGPGSTGRQRCCLEPTNADVSGRLETRAEEHLR